MISDAALVGAVAVLGDFNAHLGSCGGSRGVGERNIQGVLLQELMDRCGLSAVALGSLAKGPKHTYCGGENHTTVDYILMNLRASASLASCLTHEMADLNTSDHLPITASMLYKAHTGKDEGIFTGRRVDWDYARKTGKVTEYVQEVCVRLTPLLCNVYEGVGQLDHKISDVVKILVEIAEKRLPLIRPRRQSHWKDDILSRLCAQNRAACAAWKEAGTPQEGPLYDEKGRLRRAVRQRVRYCAAKAERLCIQRRDRLFAKIEKNRFRSQGGRQNGSKLVVNGNVVSDQEALMEVWLEHFSGLAKSRRDVLPRLDVLQRRAQAVSSGVESQGATRDPLDIAFTAEEVTKAVSRLKLRKAAGPDGLMAEHLRNGGDTLVIWLMNILNSVVELEAIPGFLKMGNLVPVYKGGGKDPFLVNSYRGITVTSTIAKVLEFLILGRLEAVFSEAGIPHVNQTA